MYGACVADQTFGGKYPDGAILVTEKQAWDDYYDGRKRDGNAARKRGDYVQSSGNIDGLGDPHADDCPTRSGELDKETER
jgi:hypothetical protein